jgi:hypothetical protein
MKVITTEACQVLQLFHADDFTPAEGVYLPIVLDAIADRYEFVSVPEEFNGDDLSKGAKFKVGHVEIGGRDIAVQQIHLYNDGVLVTAKNTKDADLATDDFCEWMIRTFKLPDAKPRRPRKYVSTVVVEFEENLDSALRQFDKISKVLSSAITDAYQVPTNIQLNRISFNADPQTVPHLFNTQFNIERRVGIPYGDNRYHSTAPLKTEIHLGCLEHLEAALAIKQIAANPATAFSKPAT